jgi:hypothetical protein
MVEISIDVTVEILLDTGMGYFHLIKLAEAMSAHLGRSEATLSNQAVGHARLFRRLRDGHGCAHHTALAAFQWFSDNWPADLEWPRGIDRPTKTKGAA